MGALPTALIEVETTHNFSGGYALPLEHLAAVRETGAEFGIPVHMDGARIFNAAVALGVPARQIAQYAGTVGFCLSKGLSAPVGSVLCGPSEVIQKARLLRRMIGGTLRQAGVLAAAGIVALEQMIVVWPRPRMPSGWPRDSTRSIPRCRPANVHTNIVKDDQRVRDARGWSPPASTSPAGPAAMPRRTCGCDASPISRPRRPRARGVRRLVERGESEGGLGGAGGGRSAAA
jgi:hypothetical protein